MSIYFSVHLGAETVGWRIPTVFQNPAINYLKIRYFARKACFGVFRLFGWDQASLNLFEASLRFLACLTTLYAVLSFDSHATVTSAHQGHGTFLSHATTVFELFCGKDLFASALCVEVGTPSFILPTR